MDMRDVRLALFGVAEDLQQRMRGRGWPDARVTVGVTSGSRVRILLESEPILRRSPESWPAFGWRNGVPERSREVEDGCIGFAKIRAENLIAHMNPGPERAIKALAPWFDPNQQPVTAS